MNELRKKRIKTVLKYTWPFYIVAVVVIAFLMNFIFGMTHKTPGYKTLTLFISGEVSDRKLLEKEMNEKFKDKDLKLLSVIQSYPSDANYHNKLSVPGYNTADVLILPSSVLETINLSAFALELEEELVNSTYQGHATYKQENVDYGIKLDKQKVNEYIKLPDEDCYMLLNSKSENIGKYSTKKNNEEHTNALELVKDWGSNA